MNDSRAKRRHQMARVKAKRRRQWADWAVTWPDPDRQIGRLARTGRLCSCDHCSRYGGRLWGRKRPAALTMQERRRHER